MLVDNKAHVPDILDCIANLSSDEVFTPPDVANQVLDLLPKEIWSNPDIKILDPCTKTGIFLRESARRLMIGLEKKIPDETERREHIFKNMLFGIAITELTGFVSRRSLYYSKDAKNDYSVVQFKDSDGNIQYKRMEHDYAQGKCKVCGSPYENLERGEGMENYAYQFIHDREVSKMKFDVVVGNPPYQIEDGGASRSATPIYQHFVNQAFRLKPRYVSMIIPSRWFAGGKGLDSFRAQMLESTNFKKLVDFPNASELFPSVEIKGGVCYFLWDEKYDGPCEVFTFQNGSMGDASTRLLGEHGDVFIRFNEALPILEKVREKSSKYVDEIVGARKPFGMPTNFKEFISKENKNSLSIYANGGKFLVEKKNVTSNQQWVDKWKVLTSNGYGAGEGYPHQIIGVPILAEPGSCCTETYIVCGVFDTEQEAKNFEKYMRTKFFRFLVALRKNTQHVTQSRFKFVPLLDMSKSWTDEKLYKTFNLSSEEIDFIDSIVREMPKDSQ
jgi:site-specific DNA-methyltransferase (adenine-specific)